MFKNDLLAKYGTGITVADFPLDVILNSLTIAKIYTNAPVAPAPVVTNFMAAARNLFVNSTSFHGILSSTKDTYNETVDSYTRIISDHNSIQDLKKNVADATKSTVELTKYMGQVISQCISVLNLYCATMMAYFSNVSSQITTYSEHRLNNKLTRDRISKFEDMLRSLSKIRRMTKLKLTKLNTTLIRNPNIIQKKFFDYNKLKLISENKIVDKMNININMKHNRSTNARIKILKIMHDIVPLCDNIRKAIYLRMFFATHFPSMDNAIDNLIESYVSLEYSQQYERCIWIIESINKIAITTTFITDNSNIRALPPTNYATTQSNSIISFIKDLINFFPVFIDPDGLNILSIPDMSSNLIRITYFPRVSSISRFLIKINAIKANPNKRRISKSDLLKIVKNMKMYFGNVVSAQKSHINLLVNDVDPVVKTLDNTIVLMESQNEGTIDLYDSTAAFFKAIHDYMSSRKLMFFGNTVDALYYNNIDSIINNYFDSKAATVSSNNRADIIKEIYSQLMSASYSTARTRNMHMISMYNTINYYALSNHIPIVDANLIANELQNYSDNEKIMAYGDRDTMSQSVRFVNNNGLALSMNTFNITDMQTFILKDSADNSITYRHILAKNVTYMESIKNGIVVRGHTTMPLINKHTLCDMNVVRYNIMVNTDAPNRITGAHLIGPPYPILAGAPIKVNGTNGWQPVPPLTETINMIMAGGNNVIGNDFLNIMTKQINTLLLIYKIFPSLKNICDMFLKIKLSNTPPNNWYDPPIPANRAIADNDRPVARKWLIDIIDTMIEIIDDINNSDSVILIKNFVPTNLVNAQLQPALVNLKTGDLKGNVNALLNIPMNNIAWYTSFLLHACNFLIHRIVSNLHNEIEKIIARMYNDSLVRPHASMTVQSLLTNTNAVNHIVKVMGNISMEHTNLATSIKPTTITSHPSIFTYENNGTNFNNKFKFFYTGTVDINVHLDEIFSAMHKLYLLDKCITSITHSDHLNCSSNSRAVYNTISAGGGIPTRIDDAPIAIGNSFHINNDPGRIQIFTYLSINTLWLQGSLGDIYRMAPLMGGIVPDPTDINVYSTYNDFMILYNGIIVDIDNIKNEILREIKCTGPNMTYTGAPLAAGVPILPLNAQNNSVLHCTRVVPSGNLVLNNNVIHKHNLYVDLLGNYTLPLLLSNIRSRFTTHLQPARNEDTALELYKAIMAYRAKRLMSIIFGHQIVRTWIWQIHLALKRIKIKKIADNIIELIQKYVLQDEIYRDFGADIKATCSFMRWVMNNGVPLPPVASAGAAENPLGVLAMMPINGDYDDTTHEAQCLAIMVLYASNPAPPVPAEGIAFYDDNKQVLEELAANFSEELDTNVKNEINLQNKEADIAARFDIFFREINKNVNKFTATLQQVVDITKYVMFNQHFKKMSLVETSDMFKFLSDMRTYENVCQDSIMNSFAIIDRSYADFEIAVSQIDAYTVFNAYMGKLIGNEDLGHTRMRYRYFSFGLADMYLDIIDAILDCISAKKIFDMHVIERYLYENHYIALNNCQKLFIWMKRYKEDKQKEEHEKKLRGIMSHKAPILLQKKIDVSKLNGGIGQIFRQFNGIKDLLDEYQSVVMPKVTMHMRINDWRAANDPDPLITDYDKEDPQYYENRYNLPFQNFEEGRENNLVVNFNGIVRDPLDTIPILKLKYNQVNDAMIGDNKSIPFDRIYNPINFPTNDIISNYMGLAANISKFKGAAVMTYGYSGTGKSMSLFGRKNENGVLQATLNAFPSNYEIFFRIYEIYGLGAPYHFYWNPNVVNPAPGVPGACNNPMPTATPRICSIIIHHQPQVNGNKLEYDLNTARHGIITNPADITEYLWNRNNPETGRPNVLPVALNLYRHPTLYPANGLVNGANNWMVSTYTKINKAQYDNFSEFVEKIEKKRGVEDRVTNQVDPNAGYEMDFCYSDTVRPRIFTVNKTVNNPQSSRSIMVYDFQIKIVENGSITYVPFLIFDLPGKEDPFKTFVEKNDPISITDVPMDTFSVPLPQGAFNVKLYKNACVLDPLMLCSDIAKTVDIENVMVPVHDPTLALGSKRMNDALWKRFAEDINSTSLPLGALIGNAGFVPGPAPVSTPVSNFYTVNSTAVGNSAEIFRVPNQAQVGAPGFTHWNPGLVVANPGQYSDQYGAFAIPASAPRSAFDAPLGARYYMRRAYVVVVKSLIKFGMFDMLADLVSRLTSDSYSKVMMIYESYNINENVLGLLYYLMKANNLGKPIKAQPIKREDEYMGATLQFINIIDILQYLTTLLTAGGMTTDTFFDNVLRPSVFKVPESDYNFINDYTTRTLFTAYKTMMNIQSSAGNLIYANPNTLIQDLENIIRTMFYLKMIGSYDSTKLYRDGDMTVCDDTGLIATHINPSEGTVDDSKNDPIMEILLRPYKETINMYYFFYTISNSNRKLKSEEQLKLLNSSMSFINEVNSSSSSSGGKKKNCVQ